ncbi:hypothetical protein OHB12_02660 [Nocardia sp. NBC_01730]|uniref:hypothetical protein n=1 Tax=Nocardia sp. NBC_01730 TaxID=2975998 RepID=UPI002E1613DF|nr:hypothetical protein OHB12_02660 [Nocardia sp. NBC_01730]
MSRSAELDRVTHLPHLVDKLRAQARRLDNAGRRDEAVEVAEEAVARAQDLLALDPDQYRPNLSWALTCAASIHFSSRRAEAADLRSRQALDLIEDLAGTGGYTAALANALHNRALALNLRDDYALSMESSARAATLYEELAAGKVDHRASWANVLCTRAISAEKLRDFDTALDCVTRAEQIYSRLAERNPAKYSADLAYALNRLASIHQSMGTAQIAALAARSLEICASLPEGQERDDLQTSALNALIRNLTGTGQPREALTHSTVLLEVQERMVARDPAETIELVIALGNHTLCLSQLGRKHEALEYARRAVDLVRPLAESEPGPNLVTMASALGRHATQLAETGRADRAIEVSAEAVACYEQLLTDHRDLHLRSAAMCLDNYALWLDRAGRTEEGFAAATRSLAMFEELLERGGDRAHLGTCLLNHASRLQHQERNTEALGYATRALELFEVLAPENPGAHAPSLARALHLQSTALDGLGRHDEALPPQQRAVRICAARAAHDRQPNLTFLAKTTCGLGKRLAQAGQWPRARDQLRTGVWLWEQLTEFDTRLHLNGLASVLSDNARLCLDHDEWAEAAAYFERAATAYQELVTRDQHAHLADLGWAVEGHAYALQKLGRRRHASAQADRTLSIWRRAVAEFPAELLPRLAAGEAWAARFRLDNDEFERAAGHMEHAVRHYCSLIDAERDDLVVTLKIALHRYARTLHRVRLCARAATAMEDAVYLARQLFETDAAQHHFRLADTLRDQTWLYSECRPAPRRGRRGPRGARRIDRSHRLRRRRSPLDPGRLSRLPGRQPRRGGEADRMPGTQRSRSGALGAACDRKGGGGSRVGVVAVAPSPLAGRTRRGRRDTTHLAARHRNTSANVRESTGQRQVPGGRTSGSRPAPRSRRMAPAGTRPQQPGAGVVGGFGRGQTPGTHSGTRRLSAAALHPSGRIVRYRSRSRSFIARNSIDRAGGRMDPTAPPTGPGGLLPRGRTAVARPRLQSGTHPGVARRRAVLGIYPERAGYPRRSAGTGADHGSADRER